MTTSPAGARLTAVDESHCDLQVGSQSLDMMAWWLLRLPTDFEILDNDELIAAYQRLATRTAKLAGHAVG